MLSGADAGIKMNSTILSSIHIIERNDKKWLTEHLGGTSRIIANR